MTEPELNGIERALSIGLPIRYRELAKTNPLDRSDHNIQIEWMIDDREIVAINRYLREEFSSVWEDYYFAIGTAPVGDVRFLDTSEDGTRVYNWDHETHEVTELAANLDEWLLQLKSA